MHESIAKQAFAGKSVPFKRALEISEKVTAAMALAVHLREAALALIPEYESRGHGRDPRTWCKTNFLRPSTPPEHKQGKREIARRLRQQERAARV